MSVVQEPLVPSLIQTRSCRPSPSMSPNFKPSNLLRLPILRPAGVSAVANSLRAVLQVNSVGGRHTARLASRHSVIEASVCAPLPEVEVP